MTGIKAFLNDTEAQDLVEYSLLLVFLALAALAIMPILGNSVNAVFSRSNSALQGGS